MGGSLSEAPDGGAPNFMIRALRDPDGANLDRIQIIKGWLDSDGETHERIYDVAVSDGRDIGADGSCRGMRSATQSILQPQVIPIRSASALLTAHIGQDPDFDPQESRLLLRACARDSDAAVDHLRRGIFRHGASRQCASYNPGSCLHHANLVYALISMCQKRCPY